jgi:cytochrome c nitrite reductase small subunit
MRGEYESWFQSGGHARIKCVDCHLPNDNPVNHYIWKGIDGMKDLVLFNAGMFSERIDATPHARRTAQANCLRCHGGMVSRVSIEGRNCWNCHRSKFHYTNP